MGLEHTTPARSAFITGLCVVGVPFVELLAFKKPVATASWLAVLLSVLGLYLLTGGGAGGTLLGDGLTLGCAVAYAFHVTLTSHLTPGTRVSTLVAVQLAVVTVGALLLVPFWKTHLEPAPALWVAVFYTGVITSAVAISIQSWAQARTSSVRAAVIYTLEPLFAVLYSAVLLGRERVGLRDAVGGVVLVVGVLCAELGGPIWNRIRGLSPGAS